MTIRANIKLLLMAAFLLSGFSLVAGASSAEPSLNSGVDLAYPAYVNYYYTPARIPWSASWNVTGSGFNKSIEVLSFPDDFPEDSYIVVVETISYKVEVPSGQEINLRFCFDGGDIGPFTVYMPHVTPWSDNGRDSYSGTEQVRVYAGGGDFAGNAVKAYLSRNSNSGNFDFTVNVMGYFLPQNSPSLAP